MRTTALPIIELEHVGMKFGSFVVHRDVSLDAKAGEVVTILGPSGTGKTVILKLIIGLLKPTSGTVTVMGKQVSALDEAEIRPLRRKIGMLFQGAALFDSLTVFENIAYSLREFGEHDEAHIAAIVSEKLEIVGLPEIQAKYPPELSGGQKKRVGLARALASAPEILLFDEPTTGLDPTAVRMIDDLILRLKRDYGICSVVVTHDIPSARRISDRWVLLNKGAVVVEGAVHELTESNDDVQRFISGRWNEEM